jgi:hypothetical protein
LHERRWLPVVVPECVEQLSVPPVVPVLEVPEVLEVLEVVEPPPLVD